MTPNPNNPRQKRAKLAEEIVQQLGQIDDGLLDGMDNDARLASGVPPSSRAGDLDFIRMSGLTRPLPAPVAGLPQYAEPDSEVSRPVSFYEKGVADVDSDMVPGALEDSSTADQEIAPHAASSAMADLRDIIAELVREDTPEEPAVEETPAAVVHEEAVPTGPTSLTAASEAALPSEIAEGPPASAAASPGQQGIEEPYEEVVPAPDDWPPAKAGKEEATPGFRSLTVDLAEAERLLEELETQPRVAETVPVQEETTPTVEANNRSFVELGAGGSRAEGPPSEWAAAGPPAAARTGREAAPTPEAVEEPGDENDDPAMSEGEESVYARPGSVRRKRRPSFHYSPRRKVLRGALAVLAVAVVVALGHQAYRMAKPHLVSPATLFKEAQRTAESGDPRGASDTYLDVVQRFPNDPSREEAEFNAAFALFSVPESDGDARACYERGKELFETFCREHPDSTAKAARAQILIGLLEYKLGNYQRTIDLVRDPELRLKDPGAALPALRTLARAYVKLGDYEAARSAYLQAASIPENQTPDRDYVELGALYVTLAEQTPDAAVSQKYQRQAIEQWRYALQVPGIDYLRKKDIRLRCEVLEQKLGAAPAAAAPSGPSKPGVAAGQTASPEPGANEKAVTSPQPEPQIQGTEPTASAEESPAKPQPAPPSAEVGTPGPVASPVEAAAPKP